MCNIILMSIAFSTDEVRSTNVIIYNKMLHTVIMECVGLKLVGRLGQEKRKEACSNN